MIGSSPNKGVYNLLFWVGVLGYSISLVRLIKISTLHWKVGLTCGIYFEEYLHPLHSGAPSPGSKNKENWPPPHQRGEWGLGGSHTAEGGIKLSNHTRGMVLAPEWLCEFYKNYLPKKHCLSKGQYLSDLTDRSK